MPALQRRKLRKIRQPQTAENHLLDLHHRPGEHHRCHHHRRRDHLSDRFDHFLRLLIHLIQLIPGRHEPRHLLCHPLHLIQRTSIHLIPGHPHHDHRTQKIQKHREKHHGHDRPKGAERRCALLIAIRHRDPREAKHHHQKERRRDPEERRVQDHDPRRRDHRPLHTLTDPHVRDRERQ